MQTNFRPEQLADPDLRESERILRACVHCGFCTATCPTYVLLRDELDSPRGRIYLIKNMLETGRVTPQVVKHIDRCLSCLSCMTTCPSGVHYMHLVDHARAFIEKHYRRPLPERLLRRLLATLLPRPALFRTALLLGRLARPFAPLLPGRLSAMLEQQPTRLPPPSWADRPQVLRPEGPRRARVAVLPGCVQQVIEPGINEATVRLLLRAGCEVVVPKIACCGALAHHLGMERRARRMAARVIRAVVAAHRAEPLDAFVINASGCGVVVRDYGFLFRTDPRMAEDAAMVGGLMRDISAFLVELGLPERVVEADSTVAFHAPCSLQHGLRAAATAKRLLTGLGLAVREPAESHLCCGSAGTYSILQPELARRLRARRIERLSATGADLVATANIGCLEWLRGGSPLPVVHVVELADWLTGGPVPPALAALAGRARTAGAPLSTPLAGS